MAAKAMPMGFCTSMWITKNQVLLPSAFQNASDHSALPNRVAKFARPTNTRSPASVTFIIDCASVPNSGMIISAV